MEMVRRIRKTDLARNTREVLNIVMRGQTAVIESHGKPEAAIIDIVDYLILRAVMRYHAKPPRIDREGGLSDAAVQAVTDLQARYNLVIAHYLADAVTLSRTAELLGFPAYDLRLRFVRLDVPLRLGPATAEDARAEIETLRRLREGDAGA
jgi:prevent-host-death family protein